VALAAGASKLESLAEQIEQFAPKLVSVPDAVAAGKLREMLGGKRKVELVYGKEGLEQVAAHPDVDMVVSGVVGAMGILPTAAAARAGKTIALANKETLVAAGSFIMPLCRKHSAIFQSLSGYESKDIKQILLTGSGGPFRTWDKERIRDASVDDALKHPNWSMGPKITVDSATLMNKGLEIIEARWLFDVRAEQIKVVIHPQSILHSAVEFVDGSIVGQLGMPDMHLPIHYALYWPERKPSKAVPLLDLVKAGTLTFEAPDLDRFPCLRLAAAAAGEDNTIPCVLNAANEVVVAAFLKRTIRFYEISQYIERVVELHKPVTQPTLDDILDADHWAREAANELLGAIAR
jgi:1-deoxy-D-xylulose-5-phosphate reductoisomerase